jgi:hypothetical protein
MTTQVSKDFLFAFKVTDVITIKSFPRLARFGELAGKPNENFLNPELFVSSFLRPCDAIRTHVGLVLFEFSRFWPSDYQHGRDFVVDLDRFLGRLPPGWPYGVEIRNRAWLRPEYFECLTRHGCPPSSPGVLQIADQLVYLFYGEVLPFPGPDGESLVIFSARSLTVVPSSRARVHVPKVDEPAVSKWAGLK